ncbi:MAG: GuaB3 family IMP dehydrogenase-related protein [Chloroflexi bacterium]|nr:MAG: GuaB3 family IMP dehydrogenase-related protein [Chloroflexota bacterium]RLC97470.1 MAG: GuaB3 family IMP dehydrogenase-related protein [Chloroflexota bacterium]
MPIHKIRELRRAYGFDEVAIVPGDTTINPEQTNISFKLGELTFPIPIVAAAMDAVVDPGFAALFSKAGGLAVLNLEGVQTRYDDPDEAIAQIIQAPAEEVTTVLQRVYAEPIKEHLIGERVRAVKQQGGVCAASVTPANTKRFAPLVAEAGGDVLVVQSTVTTARHFSKSLRGLIFSELCQSVPIPVVVGNCVTYSAALELMRTGISGILVGVGPGATCTTRQVLGIGVPQITATMDCAAARDDYAKETGKYVAVITDGGVHSGADLCKAIAAGADAVMLGAMLARAEEAPAKGYQWGMASPHPALPRGKRIKVDTTGPLDKILFGPSTVADGTQNLVGALRTAMGVCGAATISQMHQVEIVVAPAIITEGKSWQLRQASSP